MNDFERLNAIEEIKQLKARYFRSMDTKNWDGLTAVFSPDAVLDMQGEVADKSKAASGVIHGGNEIGAYIRNAVHDLVTVHHGHMPEIEITSPTTAKGIWAMEDLVQWPDGRPIKELHGFGHYHETYRKLEGQWRIQSSTLSRLRVDII